MRFLRLVALLAIVCCALSALAQKVGDRVEAWVSGGTYPGKIVGVGSGSYAGYFLVHFDSGTEQYVKASNLKVIGSGKKKLATAPSPRSGKYVILSYGNPSNPIRIGYVTLSGSSYVYKNMAGKTIGSGHFRFSAGAKTVTWLDGPFKKSKFTGAFRVEREGKTHVIQLNRVTIASNSTDSANR
jgi:hypothetical protein